MSTAIVTASRVASSASRRQASMIIANNASSITRTAYSSSKARRMVIKATNNYIVTNNSSNSDQKKTKTTMASSTTASSTASSSTQALSPTTSSTPSSTQSSRIISSSRIFSSLATAAVDSDRYDDASTQSASSQQQQQRQRQEEKEKEKEESKLPSKERLHTSFFLTSLSDKELYALASLKTTPLSLINMYRYASWPDLNKNDNLQLSESSLAKVQKQRLQNAQFLHRELPIRLAQRAVDLLTLPHGLNKTSEVRGVANVYLSYVQKFFDMESAPQNEAEEKEFTNMLESLVLDQTSIPLAIARGVRTLKDNRREDLDVRRLQEMEDALYRFFTARVGLRFLTEHHILSNPYREKTPRNDELRRSLNSIVDYNNHEEEKDDDFLGCIQKDCDTVKEVKRVADQITRRCRECYGIAPEIEILDTTKEKNASLEFTYVPHHLRYMLAELLKNSCRATVRRYLEEDSTQSDQTNSVLANSHGKYKSSISSKPAPIRVIVTKGVEDVSIKIADQGGGVPRSAIKDMWTFAHFTQDDTQDTHEMNSSFSDSVMTGGQNIRGFGLPLARIYARYFGGELTLKSMEGYGVDAYLYLPVLGSACENLPERVVMSPGNLDSSALSDDEALEEKNKNYKGDGTVDEATPDSLRIGDDLLWRRRMGTPSARQTFEMLAQRAL